MLRQSDSHLTTLVVGSEPRRAAGYAATRCGPGGNSVHSEVRTVSGDAVFRFAHFNRNLMEFTYPDLCLFAPT